MSLVFSAARAQFWLFLNLLSISAPRSSLHRYLLVYQPLACTVVWGYSIPCTGLDTCICWTSQASLPAQFSSLYRFLWVAASSRVLAAPSLVSYTYLLRLHSASIQVINNDVKHYRPRHHSLRNAPATWLSVGLCAANFHPWSWVVCTVFQPPPCC